MSRAYHSLPIVFLAAIAVVAAAVPSAHAASPNGFVVWSEGGHEDREIKYIEIAEGTGPIASSKKTAVRKGPYGDISCVISFDGSYLAFARQLESPGASRCDPPGDYHAFGNYDVYVAPLDGVLPATPTRVGHGYMPSWGDDSDQPTKTLYYSWCSGDMGGDLKIMKVTVNSNGSVTSPVTQLQNFGTSGDAHMQAAPNGMKVAWRPGGVKVYDKDAGTNVDAGGGCHPSWGPKSYWLMWANANVGAFDNGSRLWSGGSSLGAYHYGFSNDGNWVIGRIGSGSGNDQNTDYPIIYYPCNSSERGQPVSWSVNTGAGETVGRGTWCDIHVNVGPSIGLSPTSTSVAMGGSVELTLTMSGGASGQVSWSVSGGGALSGQSNTGATFTSDGTAGQYTVTATLGDLQRTATVRVVDPSAIHIMVNCGGSVVSAGGETWESDLAYAQGGSPYDFGSTFPTSGHTDPAPADVYRTVRHIGGGDNHSYVFSDVPNGEYLVRIHWSDKSGGRSMQYLIEGTQVLNNYDPPDNVIDIKEFTVDVADGDGLTIEARKSSGNDVFEAGIEIIALGGSGSTTATPVGTTLAAGDGFSVATAQAGYRIRVDRSEPYTLQVMTASGQLVARHHGSSPCEFTLGSSGAGKYLIRVHTAGQVSTGSVFLK